MEVVKLTEGQIKCLETTFERNCDAQIAFQNAAYLIRKTHGELWDIIHELFPDKKEGDGELKWGTKEIIFR